MALVGLMWIVQLINSLDNYALDNDGIHARDVDRIWGIFTAPFLHASWAHLIAQHDPARVHGPDHRARGRAPFRGRDRDRDRAGGLGTWLISPDVTTVGASGLVFGYATYLLTRGIFNRSLLELLTGAVVAVVWGRRAAREPGAARQRLLAGSPVRRDRRDPRRLADLAGPRDQHHGHRRPARTRLEPPAASGSHPNVSPGRARSGGRQARTQDPTCSSAARGSEDKAWRSSGAAITGGMFGWGPLACRVR